MWIPIAFKVQTKTNFYFTKLLTCLTGLTFENGVIAGLDTVALNLFQMNETAWMWTFGMYSVHYLLL